MKPLHSQWTTSVLILLAATTSRGAAFRDDFDEASRGVNRLDDWEVISGRWDVNEGRLVVEATGDARLFCGAVPDGDRVTIEALVTPQTRLARSGWAIAGLLLYYDDANFWQFALVASPNDERRYVELLENFRGRWQAQNDPPLRLVAQEGKDLYWEYGRTYRMRLVLTSEGIAGFVSDLDGTQLAHIEFAFDNTPAVDFGRAGMTARDVRAGFDDAVVNVAESKPARVDGLLVAEGRNGRAGLLADDLPGLRAEAVEATAEVLAKAGVGVTRLKSADLAAPGLLQSSRFDLLVLADSRAFPADATDSLMRYLRGGGKLLCIGGPPFSRLCWQVGDKWYDRDGLATQVNATRAERVLADFEALDVGAWSAATSNPEGRTQVQRDATTAAQGGASLRFDVDELTGWTTFSAPRDYGPFPEGHTLTCFYAKGAPQTKFLVVEWHEGDQSRWIATVPLTTQWQHYALPPRAFEYWKDNPSKGRGGPGDHFHPERATRLIIGLAQSHAAIAEGEHTFWIDEIGTAPSPLPDVAGDEQIQLEILSPFYKTFDFARAGLEGVAPIRRQQGLGLRRGLGRRWVPLGFADGEKRRIATASYIVNHGGVMRGSAWALIGVKDPPAWTAARTRKLIVEAARLLCRGVFVGEAGTEEFHYEPGENVTFGAKLCNFGREAVQFDVRADILPDGEAEPALRRRRSLRCEPGETATVEFVWERPGPTDSVFQVRVSVSADGRRLDEVRHEFEIGMPPTKTKGFVTVRDGDFRVGDRKWYPFGVNYRPSYVIGEPTLAWAGPYYDPHWVEEELATMESLGMNMLSITSFNEDWRDLRDLLRRCGDHGIRVNLFIPGADPMRFDEDLVRQHIRDARLAENPALFAYDIAWEPRLGRFEQRSRWDGEWGEWIVERYGSIESAEKDWGFPVPRTADGEVTGPSDAQLTVDGDHRRMVAAYRRFADDLISKRYNRATRFIRSLDPNHLISTRSGYGGTGPCYPAVMAFDMISMAKHFDFASPEGWGMTGDRDTILQSGITTAYGRFVTRGKPVMWSEFGMQKWDRSNRRPDPDRVEQEAEYYDDMYNMMLKSGAHGAVPWWWPGGFRVGENSDYGISDPNSGERPVWKTIRKYARLFARPRRLREPDTWITIDRDAHVGGYHDVYVQHKDEYGRLLKEGHFPGLRTEGTGTTSANAPLVAVGDVPYNGSNPPKYLNAEFNWVKVKVGEGEWREVEDGGEIRVPKGAKVMLSASVGNTGEASWLAGEGKGRVYLVSATGSTVDVRQPILADVPYLGDAEVRAFSLALPPGGDARLVLEMDAQGRMRFGEKFELVVRRG